MITPSFYSTLVFFHILGVTVWLGGQIILSAVVPRLRKEAPTAIKIVAQQYANIAWPALVLIVITGIFQLATQTSTEMSTEYMITFALKMTLVAVAIASTIIHSAGTSKMALAIGGAFGLLGTLGAAYLGVLLALG